MIPRFDANYQMPAAKLHNLYALLYQQTAYDITKKIRGEGLIWARASWAGSQRYPLHWGGDCACTWDGLAGSLRGGLQLGLSGFAFWSHDVPGFHGVPDFMNSWPADDCMSAGRNLVYLLPTFGITAPPLVNRTNIPP